MGGNEGEGGGGKEVCCGVRVARGRAVLVRGVGG